MTSERSGEDAAARTLRALQRAIFKYPMAVQAAFSALVAEGRAFAETPEGAEWRRRLSQDRAVARGRMVWDVLSLGSFQERYSGPLPSTFVDALSEAIHHEHLERLLSRLFGGTR